MSKKNGKRKPEAQAQEKAAWPLVWFKEGRLGVTLGDPRVWACAEGERVKRALAETATLERMWEGSPDE
jgi:hypothetical protein